jgi:hypothetical protein
MLMVDLLRNAASLFRNQSQNCHQEQPRNRLDSMCTGTPLDVEKLAGSSQDTAYSSSSSSSETNKSGKTPNRKSFQSSERTAEKPSYNAASSDIPMTYERNLFCCVRIEVSTRY